MKLSYDELSRLLDEASAVLTDEQIADIAKSMDLQPVDVLGDLYTNVAYWESIKDKVSEGDRR